MTPFLDLFGKPLTTGTWAHLSRWPWEKSDLARSFVWQVRQRTDGRLGLAPQGRRLSHVLTPARARALVAFEPHPMISLTDYPALWAQFTRAGWGAYLTTTVAGDLLLLAQRQGTTVDVVFSAMEVREALAAPDGVAAMLAEAVECVVHPIRYRRKHS